MTPPERVAQAKALIGQGRPAQAVELTREAACVPDAVAPVLSVHAEALRAAGRAPEAVAFLRRAADINTGSMVSRHNLAALLGDLGMNAEAEAEARRAFSLGGDAPETWLVLGRALQGQNRFDEAEAAYAAALSRRPAYGDALTELSQLIWMRTGDLSAALAPIDAAGPQDSQPLRQMKARVIDYAGDPRGAVEMLTSGPLDGFGHLAIAQSALQFDAALALDHVQRAAARGAPSALADVTRVECLIALSRPNEAQPIIAGLRRAAPHEQYLIALQATVLRMLDDPAYRRLYDYDAFVRPTVIDTPDGWPDLAAYLADLSLALQDLHGLKTHPVGQSLRHGSQTTAPLALSDDPAIRAFFAAIDGPIRRYMAAVGQGDDPLRARNTGDYRIGGSWSVRLRPNGFHADHVHSEGWLSSACYIDLPRAVGAGGREGWIKFGQPAIPTDPPLEAERFVQPTPGTLVLFPSYMWHGTVPFGGDETRLTIAFDVVPA